jgi:hypothetical protein
VAPLSYYYVASVSLSVGTLYALVNIILLKLKGSTTFKLPFKKGSVEHARVLTLANTKILMIVVFFTLLTSANLLLSINAFLNAYYEGMFSDSVYGILVGVPVFALLLITYLNSQMHKLTNL